MTYLIQFYNRKVYFQNFDPIDFACIGWDLIQKILFKWKFEILAWTNRLRTLAKKSKDVLRNQSGIILWASRKLLECSGSIRGTTCTSVKILWNIRKKTNFESKFFDFYEFGMTQQRKNNEFEGLLWIRVACVVHISTCWHIIKKRKALRVIPRGKQWLTVYRAPQVTIASAGGTCCVRINVLWKDDS